jgi:hypothetical protein
MLTQEMLQEMLRTEVPTPIVRAVSLSEATTVSDSYFHTHSEHKQPNDNSPLMSNNTH